MMENILVIALLALMLGGAALYIYKAKKKGRKCIGCPDSGSCPHGCGNCSGCCKEQQKN